MSIIAPSPFAPSPGTVDTVSAHATLVIADDHPLFRTALKAAVGQLLPEATTVEADSLDSLIRAVETHPDADLILLDLRMPGARGFSSLIQLRGLYPAIPVAIVSAEEEPATMRRALDFGATGFIPKSAGLGQIGQALRTMLNGGVWLPDNIGDATPSEEQLDRELAARVSSLTPQQFRVLMLLSDGRLNKQIGGDLDVAEATVKAHVTAILRKLGLYRRTQAAVLAQRLLRIDAGPIAPADVAAGLPGEDEAD
jgi:DNA-binding NarL/FixJ family response regulator